MLFYDKFLLMLIIIVGAFDYLFEFGLQQVAQNKTLVNWCNVKIGNSHIAYQYFT